MDVLRVIDLDPEETDDLAAIVAFAQEHDGYLHIEVRHTV